MNTTMLYTHTQLGECIAIDTPYGANISKEEAPVFSYLGLGGEGEEPAPAFGYITTNDIYYAVGLNALIGGYTPAEACVWASEALEAVEVSAGMRRHALRLIYSKNRWPEDYSGDDKVLAIVHKHTRQVLFYHFYVQGDGGAFLFTITEAPQESEEEEIPTFLGDFDIIGRVSISHAVEGPLGIRLYMDSRGIYWETEAITDERFPTVQAAVNDAVAFYSA